MATGKIMRKTENGVIRLHEAVSDSVYMRGDGLEAQTLTDFAKPHRISLLHISDNHGSQRGITVMKSLLADADNDDVLGINTGDITTYNYDDQSVTIEALTAHNAAHPDKPILAVKGNHDAWDVCNYDEDEANEDMLQPINGDKVTWGQVEGENQGYWYKDLTHNGVKLRLIALDEYQYSVVVPSTSSSEHNRYSKVYSSAQIEWLEAVLKSTPSDAYIIMAHHQPLYSEHPTEVLNDFVHHGMNGVSGVYPAGGTTHTYTNTMFTYLDGNIDLPARIIDAYIHKKALNYTCVNGKAGTTLMVDVDFKDCTPAKFACHINGHVHGDYCEYHPEFPEQLCLTIGTDSPSISTWYDDLERANASDDERNHIINRVTIDADRNVVVVERHGAHTLWTYNDSKQWIYHDGSARKSIEFPIKKVAVEPKAVLLLKEAFAALDLNFEQFKIAYGDV